MYRKKADVKMTAAQHPAKGWFPAWKKLLSKRKQRIRQKEFLRDIQRMLDRDAPKNSGTKSLFGRFRKKPSRRGCLRRSSPTDNRF